jgi:glycosyltransferase involved in cell wall biosynthesis
MNILFLNENPLPKPFTTGAIAGKELRLRAAIDKITAVHAISLPGPSVQIKSNSIGPLESKIHIHHTLPFPYYFSFFILFFYGLYYALKLKPVVIEAESPLFSGPAAILIGKILKIKTSVEVRASYSELAKLKLTFIPYQLKLRIINLICNFSFRHASAIIANSRHYQSQLKRLGFSSTIINPGIQFTIPKVITTKPNIIGFIGRLVPEKGVEYLIRSVSELKDLLVKNHYQIIIVGDGPHRSHLESLVSQQQLTSLIKFTGSISALSALAKLKILVNPCYVKPPLEMVNAEAAAMGVPVIGFGDANIPETIANNVSGIIVPYQNQTKLTIAIKKLVENPHLLAKLSNQAPIFANENFSFLHQVDRLSQLYSSQRII